MKDYATLGFRGEKVAVKPGYGRNFLYPQKVTFNVHHRRTLPLHSSRISTHRWLDGLTDQWWFEWMPMGGRWDGSRDDLEDKRTECIRKDEWRRWRPQLLFLFETQELSVEGSNQSRSAHTHSPAVVFGELRV